MRDDRRYAELLSDMYTSTQSAVNYHLLQNLSVPCTTLCMPCRISCVCLCRPRPEDSAERRVELIDSLDTWHFEPHKLTEEAVLACTILLFEALLRTENMAADVGFSVGSCPFLFVPAAPPG
jgi:hypothetical protein